MYRENSFINDYFHFMNLTQLRFYGFQNTPFLWKGRLLELDQFDAGNQTSKIDHKVNDTIRLGNYVERLVSYELQEHEMIQVLKENVQIISNKTTLGEIDCLLLQGNQPIHLEIAYKFYLYDSSVGESFLDHWIGPNRRDSLILKLNKIKSKQFPLLYSEACESMLNEIGLKPEQIAQQTYFKAQLFVPYQEKIDFPELNSECVCGFYISLQELNLFKDCKFYIPKKLDWLIEPHVHIDWMNHKIAKERIKEFHEKNSAPLCWIKQPNGEIQKVFVVWW